MEPQAHPITNNLRKSPFCPYGGSELEVLSVGPDRRTVTVRCVTGVREAVVVGPAD